MNCLLTVFIITGSFLIQGEAKSCGTNPSVVHLQRGQRQRVQFWTNQLGTELGAFDQDLAVESRNAALRSDEALDQQTLPEITSPLAMQSATHVTQKAESRSDDPEESDADRLSHSGDEESANLSDQRAESSDATPAPATDSPVTDPALPVDDDQVSALAMDDHQDNAGSGDASFSPPPQLDISPIPAPIPAPMAADQDSSEHSSEASDALPAETLSDEDDTNSVKAEQIAEVTLTTDVPESATEKNQPAVAEEVTEPCVTIVRYYVNAAGETVFLKPSIESHQASKSPQADAINEIPTVVQPSGDIETATHVASEPINELVTEMPVTGPSEPITEQQNDAEIGQQDAESATELAEPSVDAAADSVKSNLPEVSVEPEFPQIAEMEVSSLADEMTTSPPQPMESATEHLQSNSADDAAADETVPIADDQPSEVEPTIPVTLADIKSQQVPQTLSAESDAVDISETEVVVNVPDVLNAGISQSDSTEAPADEMPIDPAKPLESETTEIPHALHNMEADQPEINADPTESPASDLINDPVPEAIVSDVDATELPSSDTTESSPVTEVPASDENDYLAREDLLISRIRNIVDSLSKPRDSLFFKRTSGFLQTVGSVFRRPRRQTRLDPFFVIQAPDLSNSAPEATPEQEDVYRSFLQSVKSQESTGDAVIISKSAAIHQARDSISDSGIVDVKVSGVLPFQKPGYRPGSAVDDTDAIRTHLKPKSRSDDDPVQRIRRSDPDLLQFIYSRPLPLRRALAADPRAAKRIVESPKSPTECDLHIKTEPGLYLLITFHNLSAPHTVDCTGAFIEIERENNGFEARWCGNKVGQDRGTRSHVIFARTEVRISVFDSGLDSEERPFPTGFTADVEVVDLHDAGKFASFQRSEAYSSVHRRMG